MKVKSVAREKAAEFILTLGLSFFFFFLFGAAGLLAQLRTTDESVVSGLQSVNPSCQVWAEGRE